MKTTLLMALSSLFIAANGFSSDLTIIKGKDGAPSAASKITSVQLAYTGHPDNLAGGPRRLYLSSESASCLVTGALAEKRGFSLIELANLVAEDKVNVACISDESPYAEKLTLTFKVQK